MHRNSFDPRRNVKKTMTCKSHLRTFCRHIKPILVVQLFRNCLLTKNDSKGISYDKVSVDDATFGPRCAKKSDGHLMHLP